MRQLGSLMRWWRRGCEWLPNFVSNLDHIQSLTHTLKPSILTADNLFHRRHPSLSLAFTLAHTGKHTQTHTHWTLAQSPTRTKTSTGRWNNVITRMQWRGILGRRKRKLLPPQEEIPPIKNESSTPALVNNPINKTIFADWPRHLPAPSIHLYRKTMQLRVFIIFLMCCHLPLLHTRKNVRNWIMRF